MSEALNDGAVHRHGGSSTGTAVGLDQQVAVINVSGPYAVGKDTLLHEVADVLGATGHRVSTLTTRPSSPDADPSYRTVDLATLEKETASGSWIVNHQQGGSVAYATSLDEIIDRAADGQTSYHSIFAGDAGAGELRRRLGRRLFSIALLPSTGDLSAQLDELRHRLTKRGRDTPEAVERRLLSQAEIIEYVLANPVVRTFDGESLPTFDVVVINDDLETAQREIRDLVQRIE